MIDTKDTGLSITSSNPSDEYYGISDADITEKENAVLSEPLDENIVEIRPDGIIYVPQEAYRAILNKAFGRGKWAVKEKSVRNSTIDKKVFFNGILYIKGKFIAEDTGEQSYEESKSYVMSFATAKTAAKSDFITRACKDLGVYSKLWNPEFIRDWRERNAEQVECLDKANKRKVIWRRKDAPFLPPGYKELPDDFADMPKTLKDNLNLLLKKKIQRATILNIGSSLQKDYELLEKVSKIILQAIEYRESHNATKKGK